MTKKRMPMGFYSVHRLKATEDFSKPLMIVDPKRDERELLAKLILCDKIQLWHIPHNIRSTSPVFYISSFRKYRYFRCERDKKCYFRTLSVLKHDINRLKDSPMLPVLKRLYYSYRRGGFSEHLNHSLERTTRLKQRLYRIACNKIADKEYSYLSKHIDVQTFPSNAQ